MIHGLLQDFVNCKYNELGVVSRNLYSIRIEVKCLRFHFESF